MQREVLVVIIIMWEVYSALQQVFLSDCWSPGSGNKFIVRGICGLVSDFEL